MKLNHIIIGAGRSGTTSLVEYLKQHAAINFSSIKEVTYFSVNDHYKRGEQYLNSFFDDKKDGFTATSDTYLLMDKEAPKRIAEYNPNIKLTVILREPSARAYSNYHFSVNHGYIDKSITLIESEKLEAAVLAKGDIIAKNNHANFYGSLYCQHLSYWLTYFKRDQVFICTTNQLKENPQQLMDDYFNFLGLDKIEIRPLEAQHKAAAVKNKSLNKFLVNRNHWLRKLISKPLQIGILRNIVLNSNVVDKIKEGNKQQVDYTPMTTEEISFCDNYFKEDLEKLKSEFGIEFNS
jgi:hypothetical protein